MKTVPRNARVSTKSSMQHHRYVMIDVETTGLSSIRGDRVIEIGAVALEGDRVRDEFHSLVNAKKRICLDAHLVHGITDEMLIGQPKPAEVYPRFREFIHNSILVAHNA